MGIDHLSCQFCYPTLIMVEFGQGAKVKETTWQAYPIITWIIQIIIGRIQSAFTLSPLLHRICVNSKFQ